MNAVATHTASNTLHTAAVGDFIAAALVESLTAEQADAFEAAGIDVAEGTDGRLVLVDAE